MSASASQSKQDQQSTQVTTQGGSGNDSPTLSAGTSISYNDPKLAMAALTAAGEAVKAALTGAGGITQSSINTLNGLAASQAQAQAAQASQNSSLLSQVLAADQKLATAQGTGGASLTYNTNNYLIFGAIGIAVLAVLGLFFRKSK